MNTSRRPSHTTVDVLAKSCLTISDIQNAVTTLGPDLVAVRRQGDRTPGMPISGKTFKICNMTVDASGVLCATVQLDDKKTELISARPIALTTDKILSILEDKEVEGVEYSRSEGSYTRYDLFSPWLLSLEDIRQRYEQHRRTQVTQRLAFLKQALLTYDPTVFDTLSEGPAEELETGDLVRAKPRLYGEMSLNSHAVAYVYDTDISSAWLASWNQQHLALEQADCVLAQVDLNNTLVFTPANSARLMRLTEAQAAIHGNDYNPVFAEEKKTYLI